MKYLIITLLCTVLSISCSKRKRHQKAKAHTEQIEESKAPDVKGSKGLSPLNDLQNQLQEFEAELSELMISFSPPPSESETQTTIPEIQTTVPTGWFRFDRVMSTSQNKQIEKAIKNLDKFIAASKKYLDYETNEPLPKVEITAAKLHRASKVRSFLKARAEIDRLIKIKSSLATGINSFHIVYHGTEGNRTHTPYMELKDEILEMDVHEAKKVQSKLNEFIELAQKLTKVKAIDDPAFWNQETIGKKISDLVPHVQDLQIIANRVSNNHIAELADATKSYEKQGIKLDSPTELIDLDQYPSLQGIETLSDQRIRELSELADSLKQTSETLDQINESYLADNDYNVFLRESDTIQKSAEQLAALIEFRVAAITYDQEKSKILANDLSTPADYERLEKLFKDAETLYHNELVQHALNDDEATTGAKGLLFKGNDQNWYYDNQYFIENSY